MKYHIIAVASGVGGVLLVFAAIAAYHMWQDHELLHQIQRFLSQRHGV